MKLIVFSCLMAVAVAAPLSRIDYKNVQILSYENDNDGLGNYKYGFSQSDGTKQEQQGELTDGGLVVRGSFSWIGPNGHVFTVTYVADDKGYQADMDEAPGTDPALVASLLG